MLVHRNMKARLLVVFAACNVILALPVPEVAARSASTFTSRNQDPDVVVGPEENTLFNSPPDLALSSLDANFKKRTKSTSSHDSDEIMRTAETYFRPLSRYRELQKEKQEKQNKKRRYDTDNEVAAAATAPVAKVANAVYNTKLLSKNPEYCLSVKNGVVCFYKV